MIDTLLAAREASGRPIQVALVGAGVMGRMVALQLLTPPPGIRLACIVNRTTEHALQAYREGGGDAVVSVRTGSELDDAIGRAQFACTDAATVACDSALIDVVVEVTGTLETAAQTVVHAIEAKKHVVLVNAELDSTLGPVLKRRADKADVVITNIDGDEPGVAMNLIRYARTLGLRPVAAGNLKGMIDPYRTPRTQQEFALKYGQNPAIVTSFADGTKLAMETAILANASGFRVGRRGMFGPRCTHVKEISQKLPSDLMLAGGIVDYALGAEPHTGAFVVVYEENPRKRGTLSYLKMGEGPFYVLYTPYHLPHMQMVSSIARAALAKDATVAPMGRPVCDVLAVAKQDLAPGDTLDGVGGFHCYGLLENSDVVANENLLPMGIAGGCRVVRNVLKDSPLTYGDVELPGDRLIDQLRAEQDKFLR